MSSLSLLRFVGAKSHILNFGGGATIITKTSHRALF